MLGPDDSKGKSAITFGLATGEEEMHARLAKAMVEHRTGVKESEDQTSPLAKSILNVLNGPGTTIERLAFETDPSTRNAFQAVYQAKLRLIPDSLLKRIAIQDDLVATIVRARQNHVASFGRPRPDRHSTGYVVVPKVGVVDDLTPEDKTKLNKQIERAVQLLWTCGHTENVSEDERCTFAEYLSQAARSAVVVGRVATEIVWVEDMENPGQKKFHYFRVTDAGTIYKATKNKQAGDSIRREAINMLRDLKNPKITPERWQADDYAWVQVVEGRPVQAFTTNEMKVYNFYPVPDVELSGYPVTPIDTVISAVTTHINITTHSKLYFQSGRATRGMLVIKSDDATPQIVHNIKQQFNASINNVNNSWRMPVFGVGAEEDIQWQPLDSAGGKRDMEFQYLTDMNARVILSAFMMSPDELPGWAYLSRGTNNQALSESNNEYKMQAARDLGIRPLLSNFEDFINSTLLPLIDPDLAAKVDIRLVGLDTDNEEKEAVRLQQDMPLHMTYDEVLEKVEKKPLGRRWGGGLPLNPTIKSYFDQYFTVGEILEEFCDREGAAKDPQLAYRRDPFWFNAIQIAMQQQQMEMAQQQAQMQAAAGGVPPEGGGDGGDGGGEGGQPVPAEQTGEAGGGTQAFPGTETEGQRSQAVVAQASTGAAGTQPGQDLARSIDIALDSMSKAEADLPPDKRMVLANQRRTVDFFMREWLRDMHETTDAVMEVAAHHTPKGK